MFSYNVARECVVIILKNNPQNNARQKRDKKVEKLF